jgi:hypothetical protein
MTPVVNNDSIFYRPTLSSMNCLSFLSTYLLSVDAAQPVTGPELVPELAGRAARHQTRNHDPVGGEGRVLALLLRLACPRKSQHSSPGFFRQIFAIF